MSDFDFRTEFFKLRLPIYKVASAVSLHPSRLSLFLNGRLPMPTELRARLIGVLKEHEAQGSER